MTNHGDQLREAFETHESLAPDPAAVYARVQELSRNYKRRRRGAQIAGGAVLERRPGRRCHRPSRRC